MSEKSKSTTFLLCYFLGIFGVHRFYVRRWKTAVAMLLTLGGLGIWWLIDTVLIMGGKFTDADGNALRTGSPDPDQPHAGFWVRVAAFSVDMIILQLLMTVVSFVALIALGFGALATLSFDNPEAIEQFLSGPLALLNVLFLVLWPLYFGLQSASRHQATVGKRIFAIYVSSSSDGKLSLIRGLWRALCYLLSFLPFALGFVLAAFTKDKRALHDYLAGSKVMYKSADAIPAKPAASPPAPAPRVPSPDSADAAPASDKGAQIMLALGVLLLAAAAALALL